MLEITVPRILNRKQPLNGVLLKTRGGNSTLIDSATLSIGATQYSFVVRADTN